MGIGIGCGVMSRLVEIRLVGDVRGLVEDTSTFSEPTTELFVLRVSNIAGVEEDWCRRYASGHLALLTSSFSLPRNSALS